jgi:hypothetical protein
MHWLHSADQLVNHIGATCHTLDEYYRVLCELLEDRQFAIASAFSEAKRSESATVLAKDTVADKKETKINVLRSEAVLLQNNSRAIIAQPALDAARLEIWIIKTLIEEIKPKRLFRDLPDPIAHQQIQFIENIIDIAWKGFIEYLSYSAIGPETRAQLLVRGLTFEFINIRSRDQFLRYVCTSMEWDNVPCMTTALLRDLTKTVKDKLETAEPMQAYIKTYGTYLESMNNGIIQGTLGLRERNPIQIE